MNNKERRSEAAIVFPISGRDIRSEKVVMGSAPAEFFYGAINNPFTLYPPDLINSRKAPARYISQVLLKLEYFYRRYHEFPISLSRVEALRSDISSYKRVISFTDYLSLGLGIANQKTPFGPQIFGGFHGLSDIYHNQKESRKRKIKDKIQRAINGLEMVFFFGEPDMEEATDLFEIDDKKLFHFKFGIDTKFWKPARSNIDENYVLAVGSDINRDYETLLASCGDIPLKIVTKLKLQPSLKRDNLSVIGGSLHEPRLDDIGLRDLYQKAKMVVVPVKDVWQPSGYSVALQAMSCGKPLILTDFKGLWDRMMFSSGENCLLVEPGNQAALKSAIQKLNSDPELRKTLGTNAQQTCERHFNLYRMNKDFSTLLSGTNHFDIKEATE